MRVTVRELASSKAPPSRRKEEGAARGNKRQQLCFFFYLQRFRNGVFNVLYVKNAIEISRDKFSRSIVKEI